MTDILDQSEVDALLAAVDTGQVQQAQGDSGAPTIFGSRGKSQLDVTVYDFKRPERVSKDQMRALEGLHEGFARNLGAALSGYLRTIIEVSVAHIEQLTYSEFIHSLPNPTCFNLLRSDQLDGQLCLEISPLIIYPIIDRPDWDNLDHWHNSGLWDLLPDEHGTLRRVLNENYASVLREILQRESVPER